MNNRRQTIWLVSMLSLMVILSAYYLFTEPVNPSQNAVPGTQQTGGADSTKTSAGGGGGVKVTEINSATGSITDPGSAAPNGNKDAAAPTDAGSKDAAVDNGTAHASPDGGAVSPNDATVLKEMTNLKGSQYFDELKRTGMEKTQKRIEDLNKIVADTKNHTPEQAKSAVEDMARLDDADSRMTNLEVQLLQNFENAVVTQDQTNYKIVVQSAKLDRKQAVKIIDQAAKELLVKPDRLSLEFVP